MASVLRRRVFWRVYLTLLGSLALVAVLGAVIGHAVMSHGARVISFAPRRAPAALHMTLFLLVVAGAVGLSAYPVMSRITRRLEALRASVAAWSPTGDHRRAPVDGDDEIAAVAVSFNAAAARAEALLTAHRTMLAHASHELRSPLTRLRMAAELFLQAPEPRTLTTINREIAELDALVEEILLASRLDHEAEPIADQLVDCLALAAEEAARAEVAMLPVDPGSGPYLVRGSPRLLRRAMRNLIENALKHGAPPMEIILALEADRLFFTVRDRGPGLADALRERVFEPFFRPADRSEESGSWGLGLSLARQIARRHGGEVGCGVEPDGATVFTASLPRALQAA